MRGKITVRHQGGGHKRLYREIDFKRDKLNVPARVATIEYDPNRSARIALLVYAEMCIRDRSRNVWGPTRSSFNTQSVKSRPSGASSIC